MARWSVADDVVTSWMMTVCPSLVSGKYCINKLAQSQIAGRKCTQQCQAPEAVGGLFRRTDRDIDPGDLLEDCQEIVSRVALQQLACLRQALEDRPSCRIVNLFEGILKRHGNHHWLHTIVHLCSLGLAVVSIY